MADPSTTGHGGRKPGLGSDAAVLPPGASAGLGG